jgi:signal transduction histidine kinase
LHDVIFALRPPDLDDLGIVAAIDRYVQQINRTGLPCRLEVIGADHRLSPEARLGVYRIVQEALHNALRHAHADEALVRLEWTDDLLRVTIRDNGSGFDPDQASRPTSLGLLSMRERAAAIGASFEIASRLGSGTAVILERPLDFDLQIEPVTETESDVFGSDGDTGAELVSEPVEVRSE